MTRTVEPITPKEVEEARGSVPDEVLDEWNRIILERFSQDSALVLQDDIVSRIAKRMHVAHEVVFKRGWLHIHVLYRKAGWIVEYDKPGYNETYKATFTFRKK